LSGILWYIECVHPKLDRLAILEGLSPVLGPEVTATRLTYEQKLEQMYIEKVTRKARDEGVQEGRNEGAKEGQQELLLRQLARRFGALPEAVTARVTSAGREELERWS